MTGRCHTGRSRTLLIADCVVYPRILTRTTALTTPLKPLEAMAMGKPVAASDLPPMRELVRDRETGLTFPAGDEAAVAQACIALLEDAPLRARLGQRRVISSWRKGSGRIWSSDTTRSSRSALRRLRIIRIRSTPG